jgi:hypothetical protein
MSFAGWKKRQKVIRKYLPDGYHAMAELIAQAAYRAGERAGREQVEALLPNIKQWHRENVQAISAQTPDSGVPSA